MQKNALGIHWATAAAPHGLACTGRNPPHPHVGAADRAVLTCQLDNNPFTEPRRGRHGMPLSVAIVRRTLEDEAHSDHRGGNALEHGHSAGIVGV